jgi:beta-lactamase class D
MMRFLCLRSTEGWRRPSLRLFLMAMLLAALCLGVSAPRAAAQGEPQLIERPELSRFFSEVGVTGTFVLFDVGAARLTLVGRERAERPYVPASTFKIANSLIALETGVVKDESEIIPYGGKPQPFKNWERDMSMREAIAMSNVAIYQELARRIGLERYHLWLAKLNYGNQKTGEALERFWLDGPLQISAVEQVRFIAGLAEQKLSLSAHSQSIVRDILRLENRDGRVLYGKTGWQFSANPQIGWWVGWVERDGKIFTFALNMDMTSAEDAPKRMAIGKALLAELGVF